MPRYKSRKRKSGLSDAEVRAILVKAMADVGADPALVYAFQKTGVYICEENEKRLPTKSLKAFDGAVDEYFSALKRRVAITPLCLLWRLTSPEFLRTTGTHLSFLSCVLWSQGGLSAEYQSVYADRILGTGSSHTTDSLNQRERCRQHRVFLRLQRDQPAFGRAWS